MGRLGRVLTKGFDCNESCGKKGSGGAAGGGGGLITVDGNEEPWGSR